MVAIEFVILLIFVAIIATATLSKKRDTIVLNDSNFKENEQYESYIGKKVVKFFKENHSEVETILFIENLKKAIRG